MFPQAKSFLQVHKNTGAQREPTIYTLITCALELCVSGYSFIGELAGFINEQYLINVFHERLLINPHIAKVPSMALSRSFARLLKKTTTAG
jgi:hypothetical protein